MLHRLLLARLPLLLLAGRALSLPAAGGLSCRLSCHLLPPGRRLLLRLLLIVLLRLAAWAWLLL